MAKKVQTEEKHSHKHPLPTRLREWFFYPVVKGSWKLSKLSGRLSIKASKATYSIYKDSRSAGQALATNAPTKTNKPKRARQSVTEPFHEHLEPEHVAAGSFADFNDSLHNRSQIVLIFGKRGSGKSTLGFKLMENIAAKTERPAFVMGVSQELLPDWITEVSSMQEVDNNGIVLVDEGALEFSSRESMRGKNVSLGKLLATARHKDISLFFITQNTGMIDKGVLNLTDMVVAKEGSLLQKQMERPVIKNFVEKADEAIKKTTKKNRVKYCYIFTDDFEGLVSIPKPSFWSEDVSKAHRDE